MKKSKRKLTHRLWKRRIKSKLYFEIVILLALISGGVSYAFFSNSVVIPNDGTLPQPLPAKTYLWYCEVDPGQTYGYFSLLCSNKTLEQLAKDGSIQDWTKYRAIMVPDQSYEGGNVHGNLHEPNVFYEGNPVILTDQVKVFKMWYGAAWSYQNCQVGYAESKDGINWVKLGYPLSAMSRHTCPFIMKVGSQYLCYAIKDGSWSVGDHEMDLFTSYNGISWTLDTADVIKRTAGSWDGVEIGNSFVWIEGGVWKMFYDGYDGSQYQEGYATSSDGRVWTKYAGNPVLPNIRGGSVDVHKFGSTYYMWLLRSPTSSSLPTHIYRRQSTNLISWNNEKLILLCESGMSQVGDPHLLEPNYPLLQNP